MTDPIDEAGLALHGALVSGERLDGLPPGCKPTSEDQAYAIQQCIVDHDGGLSGWKVGAADSAAQPRCAPLLTSRVTEDADARMQLHRFSLGGIEAEIAVRLARDLPPRQEPYQRNDVLAAIGTVHAAIEVLDTRYRDWAAADGLSKLADLQNNGLFVLGPPQTDWRGLALETMSVTLSADGAIIKQANGGNPAGDPIRLLQWLANERASRGPWLQAGNIVTLGSCTGVWDATPPTAVVAHFEGLPPVSLQVEP
ncbi:2-keto-4-pentenoate hydratase [Natronocella acetinitrilica]|uniref:2-keto-4-pentenoate hydratase n=1 Tax=Natronocella acetinitrilica TaxID=414046 RepID=A0AAE3KAX8_9GAMM|nr:fumarylacetoacetate hydrolase family protein [Natronocella acetinitrilica]MCP1674915.1 2-keto-4-pentenoate hydratase [Natronocella acetinitrilica]